MTDSRDAASNQLHQFASSKASAAMETLTTSNGAPVDSLTASQTAGPRGPVVIQDFTLLDHIAHFDRERIPERVVHAKGAGAKGYFQVTQPELIQSICKAQIFHTLQPTPIAVRFSTVGGESGSADTVRDPRGFAIKFFTEEGVWDLVGNNTPIFFLRDPILFPRYVYVSHEPQPVSHALHSFIHTQKRNPQTNLKDPDAFWDFISLRPESIHQVSFLFADRGIPDGYRHMNGYGSHTFKNVNGDGTAVYVKYHLKTDQGIRNLDPASAEQLSASDPEYATRDLYNAIADGNFPSWTFYVQVMTMEQSASCAFDPFDLTKVWSHRDYPLQEVGRIVLDTNPTNYFADIEQLAFAPSHLVPGIEPSPDKMLQARLFSYPDTHRHRLGPNYQQLPCNCPLRASSHYQRDGTMQMDTTQSGPNYFPNSFSGPEPTNSAAWHVDTPNTASTSVQRYETGDNDNFSQCRHFFLHVLTAEGRDRLTTNMAGHLAAAQPRIHQNVLRDVLMPVHPTYAAAVQAKLSRKSKTTAPPTQAAAPLNPPRAVPPPTTQRKHQRVCPYGYGSKL